MKWNLQYFVGPKQNKDQCNEGYFDLLFCRVSVNFNGTARKCEFSEKTVLTWQQKVGREMAKCQF